MLPSRFPVTPRRAAQFAAVAVGAAALVWRLALPSEAAPPAPPGEQAQPVTAAVARLQPIPVWLGALGSVTPSALVNVMPRVAGLLSSVDFRQGAMVRSGQLLAQIDPRPFRIAVEQAQGQLAQARAQLDGARGDLERYEQLLRQDAISAQQVADQRATVAQLAAAVQSDQAALDSARLQLEWTRITAPIDGLAGLRTVDAGNMLGTSGAIGTASATPVAVIARVQPINVTFALPQQQLGALLQQLGAGHHPVVEVWDSGNTRRLAIGTLLAADNQISTTTGTLNLRAEFANRDLALYPNQFVNVRVLERTVDAAVVVPTTAIAVGAPGNYVDVIGPGGKVAMRRVTVGVAAGSLTQIVSGLQAGETVVTDGLDRLRDGSVVRVVQARPPGSQARGAGSRARGAGQHGAAAGPASGAR